MLERNMIIKKEYNIGDPVWIYGISPKNNKPVKGKVIKIINLSDAGYSYGPHYIVEIPTHIDPLLEIRTWENMSQDEKGPVGSLREIGNIAATIKKAGSVGFAFDDEYDDSDPTADEIHAALEKAQQATSHQPLVMKDPKPRRRSFRKKKS